MTNNCVFQKVIIRNASSIGWTKNFYRMAWIKFQKISNLLCHYFHVVNTSSNYNFSILDINSNHLRWFNQKTMKGSYWLLIDGSSEMATKGVTLRRSWVMGGSWEEFFVRSSRVFFRLGHSQCSVFEYMLMIYIWHKSSSKMPPIKQSRMSTKLSA